ncbi:unnamed protein product [Ambrosiozyma monospora]|uniref:Unnamed protein product n=1 Tax=Ambrosiozyma monospora TaxID=43982 RepID=A0ACB5SYM6_AMBMO|nr:unnamed protein product [Ambrosiozyma monospora]
MELQRLLHNFKPITINGIPVNSLSKPVNEFLLDHVMDKKNQESLYISFLMKPSDPNFPYELDFLKVSLAIPARYPGRSEVMPSITVLNEDIPRGFSVNVEIGFQQIVATAFKNRETKKNKKAKKESTPVPESKQSEDNDEEEADKIEMVGGNDLGAMLLTLDMYLEKFLAMEKKDTIKIVKFIKKQQGSSEKEKEKEEKKKLKKDKATKAKKEKSTTHAEPAAPVATSKTLQKRDKEIAKMKQRMRLNSVTLFKETSHNTIFKMSIPFKEENFTIEIENMEEIVIENLNVKLTVPKEYLSNAKKGLKLELDMSNAYNLRLLSSIKDKNLKLVFGKLINNINNNFTHLGLEVAKINVTVEKQESESQVGANTGSVSTNGDVTSYWSITSQLNFFVENFEKFLSPVGDFSKWLELNTMLNKSFQ